MIFYKLFAFLLVSGLFFQTIAPAQITKSDVKNSDLTPELKQNALKLLSSVARETRQFNLTENRVQAQTIVLDLMWEHNEREARAISQDAFAELRNLFDNINAPDVEAMTVREKNEHYYKRQKLAELRYDYVLTLARRDPAAALTTLAVLKAKKLEGYDPLDASKLELEVVSAMAKKDPDKTYALAKEKIAKGVTYEIIESLKDLHKRDSSLAAKLGKDVSAFIKNAAIRTPASAGDAADSETTKINSGHPEIDFGIAASFINAASEMNRRASRDKEKKTLPLLSEAEMRELVEIIARAFLTAKNPAQYAIAQVMPEVSRYAPAQAERIRLKVGADVARTLDRVVESASDYVAREEKNADELAQDADRAAPDKRDQLYTDAARKALEENKPEKAQAIAARIKDRKNYGYLFEQIETALPLAAARRGDLTEVRKMLAGLKTNYERIAALTELSLTLAAKGDNELAKNLLEEALQLLFTNPVNQTGLELAGKIAAVYALVAPDQAFMMVEAGVEQMNSYIDAGIRLDEFYDYGSLEAGELLYNSMDRQLLLHLPNSTVLLKNLARADFERTVSLTNKFVRPEIRLFARLRLVQTLLDREAVEKEKKAREQIESHDEYH